MIKLKLKSAKLSDTPGLTTKRTPSENLRAAAANYLGGKSSHYHLFYFDLNCKGASRGIVRKHVLTRLIYSLKHLLRGSNILQI